MTERLQKTLTGIEIEAMPAMEAVNIIGAGPAGLAAAIVLRRHGHAVRVYEAAPDVGHRLNGDFQGLENWSSEKDITELLGDLGIEINFLCVPSHRGAIYTRGMPPSEIRSDRPIYYLVRRGAMPGTLDIGLKEQALALGAEILFDHRLDQYDGQAIVGTGPRGADAVAVGMTFETAMEDQAAVVLDDDIAPKGYAYLLVSGGQGTMVTVLYREYRRGNECFERMVRFFRDRTALDIRGERKFGCYGNFFLRGTQVHNGKLYVGESAGFQDCLWGFGMRYAILSGYLAARSIMDGSDYDMLWKKELGPMLETSLVNRYLVEKFGHAGYRYMTRKFSADNPLAFLRKHYNRSLLKGLLLPLARWRYESRVMDRGCNHEDCSCVWCTCGERACP